jgi:hypothetical protein
MKHCLLALALWAGTTLASAQVGEKANLDVVQWYNTPPISAEQLLGHGTMIEVFRTW